MILNINVPVVLSQDAFDAIAEIASASHDADDPTPRRALVMDWLQERLMHAAHILVTLPATTSDRYAAAVAATPVERPQS